MAKIRDKVLEFAKLAEECPENLQVVCFELLLKHHLDSISPNQGKPVVGPILQETAAPSPITEKAPSVEEAAELQDDLSEPDLHTKARHFMKKNGVSLDELNNLFYKEEGQILTLYEDIKTTQMAESQVRIALLQSLRNALVTGEFATAVEDVREECKVRKCYGSNNFTANFNNNGTYFDFDKFDRKTKSIKLSEDGRKKLAEIIHEIQ